MSLAEADAVYRQLEDYRRLGGWLPVASLEAFYRLEGGELVVCPMLRDGAMSEQVAPVEWDQLDPERRRALVAVAQQLELLARRARPLFGGHE
jgi:hypothetical protein